MGPDETRSSGALRQRGGGEAAATTEATVKTGEYVFEEKPPTWGAAMEEGEAARGIDFWGRFDHGETERNRQCHKGKKTIKKLGRGQLTETLNPEWE